MSIDSLFRCKNFTFSFTLNREIKRVKIIRDGRDLRRIETGKTMLSVDSWFQEGKKIFICMNLLIPGSLTKSNELIDYLLENRRVDLCKC